jgi:hypothetical protein
MRRQSLFSVFRYVAIAPNRSTKKHGGSLGAFHNDNNMNNNNKQRMFLARLVFAVVVAASVAGL